MSSHNYAGCQDLDCALCAAVLICDCLPCKRGIFKKCVNSQAVYPLSEQQRAQGPREEIHRP